MRHVKKKKMSPVIPVLCGILAVLVVAAAVLFALRRMEKDGENDPAQVRPTAAPVQEQEGSGAEEQIPETTEAPAEVPEQNAGSDLLELDTPYCILLYPRQWEDHLYLEITEENGYCMQFHCAIDGGTPYPLFDIAFGQGEGNAVGRVEAPDGTFAEVYLTLYAPDAALNEEEQMTFYSMQEDVNVLLDHLPVTDKTEEMTEEETVPAEEPILVDTPYCTLSYPGKWEPYLQVKHEGGAAYTVGFYAVFDTQEVCLFRVLLNGNPEKAAMLVTDRDGNAVPLEIKMITLPENSLSEEELNTAQAMQEDVNEILDALNKTAE